MPCPPHGCPSLALTQARWRQLRSCAGALESIIWAYRTRAAPFEPDGLHPNANDDKAERTLHLELIEWRQGLAAGADLNSTTLRRRFPEWVFKHYQRPPKADSMWQRWMRWLVVMQKHVCCGTRSWTDAVQAKAQAKAHQEDENLKTPAYCAPLPHLQPLRPRCRAEHPAAALNLAQHAILNPFKSWLQAPPTLSFPIQLTNYCHRYFFCTKTTTVAECASWRNLTRSCACACAFARTAYYYACIPHATVHAHAPV